MATQLEILKAQKQAKQKRKRGRKKRVIQKKQKSLRSLEVAYLQNMRPLLDYFQELVEKMLLPNLVRYREQALKNKNRSDSMARFDDWIDDIGSSFSNMKKSFFERFTDPFFENLTFEQARKINFNNKKQWEESVKQAFGVPPISLETWQSEQLKAFVKENVALIKSIPEDSFSQIEKIVMRDVQAGVLTSDIAEKIESRFGVSESRAGLIARDQTNKFNGQLTEIRQTNLGITKYVWSTIIDGRERPEHRERNGNTFEWKYPVEDGHPGEAINCRCTALAVFDE